MIQRAGSFIQRKYIPLLLSSFFAYLFCIVSEFIDSAIGSKMLPEGSLVASAIEVVSPIYQIIVFVGGLISIGCATLYEHYLGKYQDKKAHKLFGQSIILSLALGIIMALIMFLCKKPFLTFFGCKETTYNLASDYYNLYIFIAFLYPQYWLLYYMVHNDADEKICFISDGAQLGVHILTAILIVKFTSLGIASLSLGTLLGLIASTLILLGHFFKKDNSIKLAWGFNYKDAIESVKLGASTTFTYLFVAIVDIVMNKFIVSRFGDDYLAVYSVANLLLNLATVYLNLGESATPFNCVYYSEKNNHGIRKVMKKAHIYALLEGLFFTIVFLSFATLFPLLYEITPEKGILYEEAKFICRIISITMIPTAFLFLYISYYPSIKKEIYSFILSTLYMLVFPLALAIPISIAMGFSGIAVGLMLVPLFSFLVLFIVLFVNKNIKKFPLLLNKDEYKVEAYDIKVNGENIVAVLNKTKVFLLNNKIKEEQINSIVQFIDEVYKVIEINNEKSSLLFSELDIMVNEKEIIITTRDNGKIFDLTDKEERDFISTRTFAKLLALPKSSSYLTTTSFNRNTFCFNIEK